MYVYVCALSLCVCPGCVCVCLRCVRVSGVRPRAHVFVWGKGESVQEKNNETINRDLKF